MKSTVKILYDMMIYSVFSQDAIRLIKDDEDDKDRNTNTSTGCLCMDAMNGNYNNN